MPGDCPTCRNTGIAHTAPHIAGITSTLTACTCEAGRDLVTRTSQSAADKPRRCSVCRGSGVIRCVCWPGDCICGWDDQPCIECDGTGWIDPEEDEDRGYD